MKRLLFESCLEDRWDLRGRARTSRSGFYCSRTRANNDKCMRIQRETEREREREREREERGTSHLSLHENVD